MQEQHSEHDREQSDAQEDERPRQQTRPEETTAACPEHRLPADERRVCVRLRPELGQACLELRGEGVHRREPRRRILLERTVDRVRDACRDVRPHVEQARR